MMKISWNWSSSVNVRTSTLKAEIENAQKGEVLPFLRRTEGCVLWGRPVREEDSANTQSSSPDSPKPSLLTTGVHALTEPVLKQNEMLASLKLTERTEVLFSCYRKTPCLGMCAFSSKSSKKEPSPWRMWTDQQNGSICETGVEMLWWHLAESNTATQPAHTPWVTEDKRKQDVHPLEYKCTPEKSHLGNLPYKGTWNWNPRNKILTPALKFSV